MTRNTPRVDGICRSSKLASVHINDDLRRNVFQAAVGPNEASEKHGKFREADAKSTVRQTRQTSRNRVGPSSHSLVARCVITEFHIRIRRSRVRQNAGLPGNLCASRVLANAATEGLGTSLLLRDKQETARPPGDANEGFHARF